METGWELVGAAVRAARDGQKLTQEELGDRVGVSTGTIRAIERGQRFTKVTPTLRAVERVFGWGVGSIESIRDGGNPLPGGKPAVHATSPTQAPAAEVVTEGLPWRVVDALAKGTNLDARVRSLGPNTEMVTIIKGRPDASREQLLAELLDWERAEGHLDRLGETPDDS